MKEEINALVAKANEGDKVALEQVIIEIKDLVYNLSVKMLTYKDDANDASQEILIKVVTHLSTFRYESNFRTWVYRIATNYLLTHKGKQSSQFSVSFEDYAKRIDLGQSDEVRFTKNEGEIALLEEEIRLGCTFGLLLCLNELDRMIFVLSTILEFSSQEGGEILDISPENFRKRLSRSRGKIQNFLDEKCGIFNQNNPCRCKRKIDFAIETDLLSPKDLMGRRFPKTSVVFADRISDLEKTIALYRASPNLPSPEVLFQDIKKILNIGIG